MKITEKLLHFIWQFQHYNNSSLVTTNGETVLVFAPGQHNTHQGPDFTNARIRIGDKIWAGTVELHIKTSDWIRHGHDADSNYHNVILHVVWEHDTNSSIAPSIPVLELNGRVPLVLWQRYEELMQSAAYIPCGKKIAGIRDITWQSWKERLLVERLQRRSHKVEQYLQQNHHHWEETFWWLLARTFGNEVNADAFERIAQSLPLPLLARNKSMLLHLEALLFGQAGLLKKDFEEEYPRLLQKEYFFLQKKYRLRRVHARLYYLRMRPFNFPTIRLAQLAALIHQSSHLFSKIKEAATAQEVKSWFEVTANDYWHYHYRFDEEAAYGVKRVGESMAVSIIINTVVPLLFTYGTYHHEPRYQEKALRWLEELKGESNAVINSFKKLGVVPQNAFDTQAILELKKEYCRTKRCLDCAVGNALLKSDNET